METLKAIPLFQHLKPAEFQFLRSMVQELRFVAGQEIFREGELGDGVYFVKSGLVEISGGSNMRRVFSRLGPGELFGEMAVIELLPRSANATAAEVTEVFFLPRGDMLAFIERSPQLAFVLLQQISHRLREFNQLHLREIIEAERLAVIGNFARSIIHDLKNPLTMIGLSAETCDMAGVSPETCGMSKQRILKQVNRINGLITDILAFTEGRRNAELRSANIRPFILEQVSELRSELSDKAIQIILENEPPDRMVSFDARQLGRVFHNLVHNAKDFLDAGGKIFLRFHSGRGEIRIEIEDTGLGIAPEIADKLFQPFATHGKAHGTGLGLSICKKIVEDHGGQIFTRYEPGHGAIFCFTLPAENRSVNC